MIGVPRTKNTYASSTQLSGFRALVKARITPSQMPIRVASAREIALTSMVVQRPGRSLGTTSIM